MPCYTDYIRMFPLDVASQDAATTSTTVESCVCMSVSVVLYRMTLPTLCAREQNEHTHTRCTLRLHNVNRIRLRAKRMFGVPTELFQTFQQLFLTNPSALYAVAGRWLVHTLKLNWEKTVVRLLHYYCHCVTVYTVPMLMIWFLWFCSHTDSHLISSIHTWIFMCRNFVCCLRQHEEFLSKMLHLVSHFQSGNRIRVNVCQWPDRFSHDFDDFFVFLHWNPFRSKNTFAFCQFF